MKNLMLLLLNVICLYGFGQTKTTKTAPQPTNNHQQVITLTKEALQNKIQGGWAGQTIGVTFGGAMEFR